MGVPAQTTKLTCSDVEPLLHLLCDGELIDEEAELGAHLDICANCRQSERRLRLMKGAFATLPQMHAPDALVQRIRNDVSADQKRQRLRRSKNAPWLIAALATGTLAVAFVVAVVVRPQEAAPTSLSAETIADAALARHALDVPMDIASADARQVEAFLRPRLGAATRVPRLHKEGFALLGGRVIEVLDHRAAQLVYLSAYGERLTLLSVPDRRPPSAAASGTSSGTPKLGRVRVWTSGEALWSLVADVDDRGLDAVVAAARFP